MWQPPIRVDTDTWIVLRESSTYPTAVIRRYGDTQGGARYLLLKWAVRSEDWKLVGIHGSVEEADQAVPRMDRENLAAPLSPAASHDMRQKRERALQREREMRGY